MRAEHTAGPYEVVRQFNGEVDIVAQGNKLAVVQDMSATTDNTAANADLFAAAPEMFDMLRSIWVNIPGPVLEKYGLSDEEIASLIVKVKRY